MELRESFSQANQVRVDVYILNNGLRVLHVNDPSIGVFSYQTWFRVGSKNEKMGETGLAHMFEHLMFRATKNYADGEFDRLMESVGGNTNAATWVDWTVYQNSLPAGNLELCVRLEADRMANLRLTKDQLTSERNVVLNERSYRVDDDPDETMSEHMYATVFSVHPYRWPTIGLRKDIEDYNLDKLNRFYETYYAPNNATVVIAGNVSSEEVKETVDRYYSILPGKEIPTDQSEQEPVQNSEQIVNLKLGLESEKLLLGYRQCGHAHPDYPVWEVISELLTGGRSGRLYRRLVLDEKAATDVFAYPTPFVDPGIYEIGATARKKISSESILTLIDDEIGKLQSTLIPEAELQKAQNQYRLDFFRRLQSCSGKAESLGQFDLVMNDFKKLFEWSEIVRNITPEDVLRVAQAHLKPNFRTVITAAPKEYDSSA